MRLRWRWVLAFAVAAGLWQAEVIQKWVGRGLEQLGSVSLSGSASPDWRLGKVRQSIVSIVYGLRQDQWLVFDLPPEQQSVRLLTNADFPTSRRGDFPSPLPDEARWPYAFRYQVLAADGRVLAERDYHQETRLTEYRDPETGAATTGAFYLGRDVTAADGHSVQVNFAELPAPAARLRVRLLQAEDPLTAVFLRVYYQKGIPEYQVRYRWQRMFEDRKEKMVRSNIYSTPLLTEQERRNVLLQSWSGIAPQGVPGRDYEARDLYVLNEIQGEQVRDRPPPAGLLVGPDRRAVFSIPEEGGTVNLVFEPTEPSTPLPGNSVVGRPFQAARESRDGLERPSYNVPFFAPDAGVVLRWFGKGITQRQTFEVPWNGKDTAFQQSLAGGILEVQAPAAAGVRAFLLEGRRPDRKHLPGDREITPELIYVWSYLLHGEAPVDFDVLHDGQEATPVRVDLRQFVPLARDLPGARPAHVFDPLKVHYQMLDAQGRPVREGELTVDKPHSLYDRLMLDRQQCPVTEAASFFFYPPPGVVRLRFPPAPVPVVATAFNRPARLVKKTLVPDDYYRFNRDDILQRSWFLFRASRHDSLQVVDRVPILMVQTRLQEDNPDVRAGRYQWEDYCPPDGTWRARDFLTPRDPYTVFRTETLPATYQELPVGAETLLKFKAQPGRKDVPFSLLYLAREPDPVTLQVFVDGRPYHQARVGGTKGEILLPPLPLAAGEGSRPIRVSASRPVRVFLNYADPGTADGFVKRLAIRLEGDGLSFTYEKVAPEDEILSLNLFRPFGTAEHTLVSARIEGAPAGLGPYTSWTFRERLYDLGPAPGPPVPVLGTRQEEADQGQPFFFPMGNDLPPGRYRVHIKLEKGPGGHVLLSRTTPGPYERRDLFFEQPYRAGPDRAP